MEPEKKKKGKRKGKKAVSDKSSRDDKKRVADGTDKQIDNDEQARQKACTFDHFEVDYAIWYNYAILADNPLKKGVILIHKPTYRPFIIIAELPHESRGQGDVLDDAIDDVEYFFIKDQLDEGGGYILELIKCHLAPLYAPVFIEATCAIYEQIGALSPQDGEAHRIAMMHYFEMTSEKPDAQVPLRLQQERRILRSRRALVSAPDSGAGGDMDVDNK